MLFCFIKKARVNTPPLPALPQEVRLPNRGQTFLRDQHFQILNWIQISYGYFA